jgi:ECF transporter S component (folate family)
MSEKRRKKIPLSGLIAMSFLTALEIVLTRLLSINTPIVRVSLGFLPISVVAILYGPLWSAAACALGDVIGASLFPTAPFFPGFTLTAFLSGLVFGLFLHEKAVTWKNALPAAAVICVILNLGMDSCWLYIMLGRAFLAYLPARAAKAAVMLPLETILIPLVWRYLERHIPAAIRPSA